MGDQAVLKAILSMLLFFKVPDEVQCWAKKQPSYEAHNIKTSIHFSGEACLLAAEVEMYHPSDPN